MYNEVFNKLSRAKRTMKSRTFKISLLFFNKIINKIIDDPKIDFKSLYEFCMDKHFLFSTTSRVIIFRSVEVTIKTTGLLAQVLENFGATNFQEISDNIRNSLFTLQERLEKGLDVKIQICQLKKTLEALNSII